MVLYLIGSIFDYDVINMKPHENHTVKVYDVIGNMTSQSIYDIIINLSHILWFLLIKLAEVCTLRVLLVIHVNVLITLVHIYFYTCLSQ